MMEESIKEDLIRKVFADVEPEPPPEPAAEAEVQEVPAAGPAEGEALAEEAPRDPRLKWYVIHTYSGYENKVKSNLERRMQSMRSQGGEKITQVLVPTEKEKEIKGGKRREVDRKIYPGYVLVEMIMDDDSWYVVRNTPGVTGFVGSGARPVPLEDLEVKQLLRQLRDETPKYRITFQKGSTVRITSGPFADFTGVVDEVMLEKEKVRVLVSIFGRATPVELNFGDVEKI